MMIFTRRQRDRVIDTAVGILNALISVIKTEELLRDVELGRESRGTESSSRLLLTAEGLVVEEWHRWSDMFDEKYDRTDRIPVKADELGKIASRFNLSERKLKALLAEIRS